MDSHRQILELYNHLITGLLWEMGWAMGGIFSLPHSFLCGLTSLLM